MIQAFLLGGVAVVMGVLVVDDNRDIREGIAQLLRMLGYEVTTARHGKEALELLHKLEDTTNLVLLDLMMPVMDGHTFRERQLADTSLADIPVCLVSAEANLGQKAAEMGAFAYLSKPFNFPQLVALVREAHAE